MQFRGRFHFAAGLPLLLPVLAGLTAIAAGPHPSARAAVSPGDPEPQRVTFQTEDKVALVGTFFAPIDAKKKAPCVVLVHGAGGSRAEVQMLALRLEKAGFAALTIDLRGHGESATDELNWKKLDSAAQASAWTSMSRDVKAGVDFVLTQTGVNTTGVSLIGHGAGCALVARHAKRDEKVRDIVLLSPQTEQLGSTLKRDLIEIGGLPIYIGVGKAEAATAQRLAESTSRASSEEPVETNVSKVEAEELLGDVKLAGELARWMKSKALPGEPAGRSLNSRPLR